METVVKTKALLGMLVIALGMTSATAQEMTDDAIKDRIKPYGSVNVAGAKAENAGGSAARSGEDVYNGACVACHGSGVLGAPKLHVAADWQPRLDERGLDGVWNNALNGINAMPPRGTCGDCSDEEIKAAIEYMIEGI